jgi:hypothetical protein
MWCSEYEKKNQSLIIINQAADAFASVHSSRRLRLYIHCNNFLFKLTIIKQIIKKKEAGIDQDSINK